MQNQHEPTKRSGSVIDLGPISSVCRDLVSWYDRQLAGAQPKVAELESIVTAMKALPVLPGRLGRDIDLVIAGGNNRSPGETVGAIERLRLIANHHPARTPSPQTTEPRDRERRTRRRRPNKHDQETLPGFESPPAEESSWPSS